MNVFEKLQNMRVELQQKNIKKSGRNKFAGYDYYELSDVLPVINELQAKYKTCSFVSFNSELAVLTIVNAEKPEEQITFSSPMAGLNLKGAHEIQNLGGIQTYSRRYLYLNAFEITENDYFDATQGKNQQPEFKPKAVASNQKKEPSQAWRKKMNALIVEYAKASGKEIPEITEELKNVINKDLSLINDSESAGLTAYLTKVIARIKLQGGE